MGWRLHTGVTGLLGQYLLKEDLRHRQPVVVLGRSRGCVTASERVDRIIGVWESRLGRLLPRPVVLEGDLISSNLGLSKSQLAWFSRNVTSVVHAAASVRFQESQGEPMCSNVDGTRNLLQFCDDSAVEDFHYVSTAYSCGKVKSDTIVKEEPHSVDGPFWNVYEQSKCLAEQSVLNAKGRFSRTIYRPSVIVGESDTGYIPSFNAIYTLLRFAWLSFRNTSISIRSIDDLLNLLELPFDGAKNLVTVDWVSETIRSIVNQPKRHGRIYHLTNPTPTSNRELGSAMAAALSISVDPNCTPTSLDEHLLSGLRNFREQTDSFNDYSERDPVFESTQFSGQSEVRACPSIGVEELTRSMSYAVKSRFSNESMSYSDKDAEPRRLLGELIGNRGSKKKVGDRKATSRGRMRLRHMNSESHQRNDDGDLTRPKNSLRLILSGSGGGDWQILLTSSGLSVELPTLDQPDTVTLYGSAATFRAWRNRQVHFEQALRSGAFVVLGPSTTLSELSEIMSRFGRSLDRFEKQTQGVSETPAFSVSKPVVVAETAKC